MRAFVTGACGFIASHLAEALIEAGHEVTALAEYDPRGGFGWLDECDGMAKVHGDIRDAEQIRHLIEGHDIVFHLAAQVEVPYSYVAPRTFVDTNIVGTFNVLEAVKATRAKIVHTSSSEVYGTALYTPQDEKHPLQAQSPYAASKIAADKLVESYHRSYDLEAVILRPFNTFGPRQSDRAVIARIIRQALDDECPMISLGTLDSKRDFTYVSDTVSRFIDMIGEPYGVHNAGSGQNVTIATLASQIRELIGTDKPIVSSCPPRPENSEVHELMAPDTKRNAVSLDEGLRKTIAWHRR